MQLQKGLQVFDSSGNRVILETELGKGGEGSVWSVSGTSDFVAKFYHQVFSSVQLRKLETMARLKNDSLLSIAAWPVDTLRTKPGGEVAGFLMPRIGGHQETHLLYSPKSRRQAFPEAQFDFLLHVAANVARAFAVVHGAGQVIGDVNEKNLLVSSQGVVKLIDCDSFEISDQGMVFPCRVGVSTYTPPELQGRSFAGVKRTQQHDSFGLAVLIFHLLFLGRHPFAGIYRGGTADITIEQAIAELRFAYLNNQSLTNLAPPPSAPRLTDLPVDTAALFLRTFSRDGMTGNRPSAHEWITNLEQALKQLKRCAADRSHQYFSTLTTCPWCRVEAMVGFKLFGVGKLTSSHDAVDVAELWAAIEAIKCPPISPDPPDPPSFVSTCSPDQEIDTIISQRRFKRVTAVLILSVAAAIVVALAPPGIISLVILFFGFAGLKKHWNEGRALEHKFTKQHEAAAMTYKASIRAWDEVKNPEPHFVAERERLSLARVSLGELPRLRAQKLDTLNGLRRERQLQLFLERHRIEDAVIEKIGDGRKMLLKSYNIEDASDVDTIRLQGIKGFGPALINNLLAWRRHVERGFRFDPNLGIDPRDVNAVDTEIANKRNEYLQQLNMGPQVLKQNVATWQTRRTLQYQKVAEAARALAQCQVDITALRRW